MALNTKAINNRIKSVSNTRKITSAMEKVSAAKMRKSVAKTMQSKDYTGLAANIIEQIGRAKYSHALLSKNKAAKELWIVQTSNRGLCGSFNSKIIGLLEQELKKTTKEIDVICIGLKGAKYAKNHANVIAVYEKLPDSPSYDDILPFAKTAVDAYLAKQYSSVKVLYTNYISGLKQEVVSKQLLPMSGAVDLDEVANANEATESDEYTSPELEYILEPGKTMLLSYVLPKIFEAQIYQSVLESSASEHSSRMIAMKNATDSASDLKEALTLQFNKARQAAITQEIAEIVGTAAALT